MPTTRKGQAGAPTASAVRVGRVVAFLAAGALFYYGARGAAIAVLLVGVVGGALLSAWLDSQARGQRQQLFEEWAQRRGLRREHDPVAQAHRFVLFQERSLSITNAASKPADEGEVALLEWKFSTGSSSGRLVRCTGLLLRGRPTGSHLLLRPAGKARLPRIPGTPPAHETGFAALDDAFSITIEDGDAPEWIDAEVAEALGAFARRGASVEIRDQMTVVKSAQLDPDQWDGLLADGERFAVALARAAGH